MQTNSDSEHQIFQDHECILYHCKFCDRQIQTNPDPKHHIQSHESFYIIVIFVTEKHQTNTDEGHHFRDHEVFYLMVNFLIEKYEQMLIQSIILEIMEHSISL